MQHANQNIFYSASIAVVLMLAVAASSPSFQAHAKNNAISSAGDIATAGMVDAEMYEQSAPSGELLVP